MNKILIVYYSRRGENHYAGGLKFLEEGNTEKVAKLIAAAVDAELFQVETVKPYAVGYRECCCEAVAEWKAGARPEIVGYVENMEAYDTVFVGYPIWCGTMPMCMYTFLEHYDLSGKKIVPFCTHEGSSLANSVNEIGRICPGAVVAEALAVKGCEVEENAERIARWVRSSVV